MLFELSSVDCQLHTMKETYNNVKWSISDNVLWNDSSVIIYCEMTKNHTAGVQLEVCPDYGVESPFSGETNGEELDQTDLKNMNQFEAPSYKN